MVAKLCLNAAKVLVDCLLSQGVKRAFCVPGESYLPVIDALYEKRTEIDLITCRHEGAAAMMAEAYGKLNQAPGICFVTRGPGATNASIGVHIAQQDSTPMILFIGQVGQDVYCREGFQEVDFCQFFRPIAKWVEQIDCAERLPEIMSRAFHMACSGRPGPVVIVLPENILTEDIPYAIPAKCQIVRAAPPAADIARFLGMLQHAKKPILWLGGNHWDAQAIEDVIFCAERLSIPVVASFRCQDIFPNTHANYVGDMGLGVNPKLKEALAESDCIIALNTRLSEITSQDYTIPACPFPEQTLIHIYEDARELGKVYQAALHILSTPHHFVAAWRHLIETSLVKPHSETNAWLATLRAAYQAFIQPIPQLGEVNLSEIMVYLREHLPKDAFMCNGAGNYASWLHRFYTFKTFRTQLAPRCGAMGYGLPAAVSAKLEYPEREVIAWLGDGCFMMTMPELATIQHLGLKLIIIIINNAMLGTIRMHQERHFPAHVYATNLTNPSFVELAKSFGFEGHFVTTTEGFYQAFKEAKNSARTTLIEIKTNPEQLSPSLTITAKKK